MTGSFNHLPLRCPPNARNTKLVETYYSLNWAYRQMTSFSAHLWSAKKWYRIRLIMPHLLHCGLISRLITWMSKIDYVTDRQTTTHWSRKKVVKIQFNYFKMQAIKCVIVGDGDSGESILLQLLNPLQLTLTATCISLLKGKKFYSSVTHQSLFQLNTSRQFSTTTQSV